MPPCPDIQEATRRLALAYVSARAAESTGDQTALIRAATEASRGVQAIVRRLGADAQPLPCAGECA